MDELMKMKKLSLSKLQSIARRRGLKGYSKLERNELVQLINGSLSTYRAIAEQHGLTDY